MGRHALPLQSFNSSLLLYSTAQLESHEKSLAVPNDAQFDSRTNGNTL